MNVFIYTTALVLLIFYIGKKPVDFVSLETEKAKIRDTSTLFFLLGTILFAYVAGQRFAFGDTGAYWGYFANSNQTISECISGFKLGEEWLFQFYMVFVKNIITTEPRIFIEITSFITIVPIMYFYFNYSGDLKFAFYLFVVCGCWEHTMNGLRQYLASSILLMAIAWLYKRKWYLYIPIVIIAAQIHTSAYIFLLLYFIANKPAFGNFTKFILGASVFLAVSFPITGNFIDGLLFSTEYGERYGTNDFDYGINIFRVLVMAVPVVLAYINRNDIKGKYKYYDVVFNMSMFCFITTLLGLLSAVYARLNLYFEIFNVILLVWNINEMVKKKEYKWIKFAACVLYFAYFIYQMIFTYNLSWHEDYLFFIDNWKERSWI